MKIFYRIFFMLVIAGQSGAQGLATKMYISVPEENLRIAPNGKKTGSLVQGTETTVLVEQGQWLKVQVTGWIWKGSLSATSPTNISGEFRALHILVKTRAEAEDILKQIQSGKDFSDLAKSKSISPSAIKGGDLGYFNRGDFDSKIEQTIAALNVNQVSDIIETGHGFNIFKRIK
jgi:parvulin-like peptidyl-prolyl isomerase